MIAARDCRATGRTRRFRLPLNSAAIRQRGARGHRIFGRPSAVGRTPQPWTARSGFQVLAGASWRPTDPFVFDHHRRWKPPRPCRLADIGPGEGLAALPRCRALPHRGDSACVPPPPAGRCKRAAMVAVRAATAAQIYRRSWTFWSRTGPVHRQFFPCYAATDFFKPDGAATRSSSRRSAAGVSRIAIVGHVGRVGSARLSEVSRPRLQWLRALGATAVQWLGETPRTAAAAGARRTVSLSHRRAARSRRQQLGGVPRGSSIMPWTWSSDAPATHLLLGLHESDPLLPVAQSRAAICYTTRLYLVCWEDGEPFRAGLDGRVPYLELGSL